MTLSNVQNLCNGYVSSFVNQIEKPLLNETTKKVIFLALAIFVIVALVMAFSQYSSQSSPTSSHFSPTPSESTPKFILKRDADGLYTLPHFKMPGFTNEGNSRAAEFNIHVGDFVLDTAAGVLPPGWTIQK